MSASQDLDSRRIGLFGGTFDPIHRGHIEVAVAVRRRFGLDEICLVLAAQPPHKRGAAITAPADRLAMVRLAAAEQPGFTVSDLELQRQGPSYTIDTVAQVKGSCPPGTRVYFLLGSDAFLEFNTWKAYNALLREVPLIVLARGGAISDVPADMIAAMKRFIDRHFPSGYRWEAETARFVHPDGQPIYFFDGPRLDISATGIRRCISRGDPARSLLPAAVADYIETKGLYR